ncbi:MAG: 4-hydroxy-tetrahydrodipicolinate synthase [Saprospiraceae bacterium]
MNQRQLKGTGVALVTPFKNGKVDFDALEKVIEHCIDGGVDFLVSLGTTGEAITLTSDECRQVFDFTLKVNNGRLPMVVGFFGGNDTANLIRRINNFNFDGFDAMMSSGPAYNKPTQEGFYQHFMAMQEHAPLPVIIYNVPGRTASNISGETIVRLAHASEKFIAVKEASGDLNQAMHILKYKPDSFEVLSGDDQLTLPMLACGANGVISVIANAFPYQFSTMVRAGLERDFQKAKMYNDMLLDVHPWLYNDGNPCGIKAAMNILGFCENELRLPLVPVGEDTYAHLKKEMEPLLVKA